METPKDITELQNELLKAFILVRDDARRAGQGKEMANLAGKVLKAIEVQMEYSTLLGHEPSIPFMGKQSGIPLKLFIAPLTDKKARKAL